MRFKEIYQRRCKAKLTAAEAAELLGVSERTFNRWRCRFEEEGVEGLVDRRVDKAAHNSAPVDEVNEMLTLFETHYSNFNVSHFYDKYRFEHQGWRSYGWVKNRLQESGLVKKSKKKGAHRKRRERRPMKGMLIHQDGSTHEWIDGVKWDLIVTMDDADSEIYSARFVKEEGTFSSFAGVKDIIKKHGLFCTFYSDRARHYWVTDEAGGKVNKRQLTQFGRAMQQLGIEMIAAYSPEARGRSERRFGTLQERLPKELKLAGIRSMSDANQFLKTNFLPPFNARFKVKAKATESAFVPWIDSNMNLDDILCVQAQRTVDKANTVNYKNKTLQIPSDRYRHSYQKCRVRIHEYTDGLLAIFYGPRCLRYDKQGNLLGEHQAAA